MQERIQEAIRATYSFSGWDFSNESEFKHELFHQLARLDFDGTPLGSVTSGHISPRLHAEAKVESGNRAKTDLVLCDPGVKKGFNYRVEHVIELKVSLTNTALKNELEKVARYRENFEGIWLVSAKPVSASPEKIPTEHSNAKQIRIVGPDFFESGVKESFRIEPERSLEDASEILHQCIDVALQQYGNGKKQYHSFYWCNFEGELGRHHSFPCEGDFNAQLYHLLRTRLSDSIRIHSEYSPKNMPRRRIDFVIEGRDWAIPVEVKMNWDQFKPIPHEAQTILERLGAVYEEFEAVSPVLIVIQGEWRTGTPKRRKYNGLRVLNTTRVPVTLVSYNEIINRIERTNLGRD